MFSFSKRTQWDSTPNPLSAKLAQLQSSGEELIDLTISNPTQCGFEYLKADYLQSLTQPENLSYDPDCHGLASARQAVCQYYQNKGIDLDPHQVFLTANTSEAYTFIFKLLMDPQDSLFVPEPSYPLFNYLNDLNDLQAIRYPLLYANTNEWKIPFDSFKNSDLKKAKAILTVNPNNPTGNYLSCDEQNQLIEIAKENDLALIADEVFFDFPLHTDPLEVKSFCHNQECLTFTLSGASKTLGLPQMKVSWLIISGPEKLKQEAIEKMEVIADTFLSASTPSQNALSGWFDRIGEIQFEILNRIRENYGQLQEFCKHQSHIKIFDTQAGWSALLQLPKTKSDEQWALDLLEQNKMVVHPGYLFDLTEESCINISLLVPPDQFKEGLIQIFTEAGKTSHV